MDFLLPSLYNPRKTDARGNTLIRLKGMIAIPFAFCSTGGELLHIREVYTNRLSPSTKNPAFRIFSLSSSRLLAIIALSRCTLNLIHSNLFDTGKICDITSIPSNFSNFSNLFDSFHILKFTFNWKNFKKLS